MMQREMKPDKRVEVRLNGFGDDEWFAATVTGKARKQHVTLDAHPFGGEPFTYQADETSIAEWRSLPDQEIPSALDHLYEMVRVPANWNGDDEPETVDDLPALPRKTIPAADRELLELAARALGARFEEVDGEGYGNLYFEDGSTVFAWNSLVHSDDAFNMAVDLGIVIRPFGNHHQGSQVVACVHPLIEEREYAADHDHDLKAATRRAVTRAAAEIGKQRS